MSFKQRDSKIVDMLIITGYLAGLIICCVFVYLGKIYYSDEISIFMRRPLNSIFFNLPMIVFFLSFLMFYMINTFFGSEKKLKIKSVILISNILLFIIFVCAGFLTIPFLNTQLLFYKLA